MAQGSSEAAARRPRLGHLARVEPGVPPGPAGSRPRRRHGNGPFPVHRVSAPPLRAPGTMVPLRAVTARGQHVPFKSGAAMICLVLGLFAGLFHSGTERDGTLGSGCEEQGPALSLRLRARDVPFLGRDPAAVGPGLGPPVPLRPTAAGRTALPFSAGTWEPPCVPTAEGLRPPCARLAGGPQESHSALRPLSSPCSLQRGQ